MSKTSSTTGNNASLLAPGGACPHCQAPSGALSLLTSMTRYYVCGSCAGRWRVARNWQVVQEGIDGDGAAPEPALLCSNARS